MEERECTRCGHKGPAKEFATINLCIVCLEDMGG